MNSKKMMYIAIGITVFLVLTMGISVVFMTGGFGGGGKMDKSMKDAVSTYLTNVNKGKLDDAYMGLSKMTQGVISQDNYKELMGILLDEEDVRFEIDDKKEVTAAKIGQDKDGNGGFEVLNVPITRIYKTNIDGVKHDVTEDMVLQMVDEDGASKVYYSLSNIGEYVEEYILGKANRAAIEALQNKNDEEVLNKNVAIIDRCLNHVNTLNSEYERYEKVLLEVNLMTAYKHFALNDLQNALGSIEVAYNCTKTVEEKIRVTSVEAELYKSTGDYSSAVKALSKGLEIDPNNSQLRKEYREINARMLDKIESSLSSGWIQVKSAIGQRKKERERILTDVALLDAENAIKVKTDAPDGYYLKGNILYCLERYSEAITELESALQYANVEDTAFRNKVSEILGMAKIAYNTPGEVKFDSNSYSAVFDGEIRSYIFRDNEVGGLIDSI